MSTLASPETRPAGIPCQLVSWEQFTVLSRQLARAVHTSWFRPDLIVAIGRGGYLPARMLSDYLDVFDLASVKIEHYVGVHRQTLARIRYPLSAQLQGRHVLLVDDVTDSGETFHVAREHLLSQGEPAELKTAVLHHKTVSGFVPDYYAEEVRAWRWIIYPWALMEDLKSFLHQMDAPPDSVEAFSAYLVAQHGIRVPVETLEEVLALARG